MHEARVTIRGVAPYSQSQYYETPKLPKENMRDYEARTWRDRLHVDENGIVFVPPNCFKNAISEVAKFLSVQIPGKGKATYTKHFEAGVSVWDPLSLGVKKADVAGEWIHVPSDGRRGGTKRVMKCFPVIHKWGGEVIFHILDDTVTKDAFAQHVTEAGKFIGIGRFRPRNNGFYGRFAVEKIDWK